MMPTAAAIPCYRCGDRPTVSVFQFCAPAGGIPLCGPCDFLLNDLALDFVSYGRRPSAMAAYAEELSANMTLAHDALVFMLEREGMA